MKSLDNLLSQMTTDQKAPIIKILGLKTNDNISIKEKLSKILLPAGGFLQTPLNYNQFLNKIAEKNSEKINFGLGNISAETELYIKLFQQEFEKLSKDEQEKILIELEKAGLDKSQISSLSGFTMLGAAQLSGFGVYVLASSTVGAITSVLGFTLPFAIYTSLSSLISFVIGPVGFLVMGVMIYRSFKHVKSWDEGVELLKNSWTGVKNLTMGDYSRATLAFKYLAASRIIISENLKKEICDNDSNTKSENNIIESKKNNISAINLAIKKEIDFKIQEEKNSNSIERIIEQKNRELKIIQGKISRYESQIQSLQDKISRENTIIKLHESKIQNNKNNILQIESKIKLLNS